MTARPSDLIQPGCPLCGLAGQEPVVRRPPFGVVRCRACGCHYTSPRFDSAALRACREHAYNADHLEFYQREQAPVCEQRYRLGLDRLGKPRGKLLDIGGFTGEFVRLARAAGWDASGIEPLAGAVTLARSRGLPVERAEIETFATPAGALAAVTLWDVLEHLEQPRRLVERIAGWLEPGGQLLIRVPDFAGYLRERPAAFAVQYRQWGFPLDLDQRLTHFTEADLRRLLTAAGFTIERTWGEGEREPVDPRRPWPERWARRLTLWGARRLNRRRELTLIARRNGSAQ